jgi:peptidase M28-like protein
VTATILPVPVDVHHQEPVVSRFFVSLALVAVATTLPAQAKRSAAPKEKIVWPDEGPATWAPRPTVPAITANDLRTRLYQFADDSMMGRRIGEPGNYKGTEYIAREFARLGLKPAGENGTYFQEMPYGPVGFDVATSRLVIGGTPLSAKSDWVPVVPNAANGFSTSADFADIPTVFAGRWGDTATVLDAAAFSGKVAVFVAAPAAAGLQVGGRGPAPLLGCEEYPDRFGAGAAALVEAAVRRADSVARSMGRVPRPTPPTRDPRAARLGARAILLVALDSASANSVNAVFNERSSMRPGEGASAPGAAISASVASRLFGRPVDQLSVGAAGQPLTGKWVYAWRMSATPARNVLAVLPGSDPARAGEYVMVSAHNDHVGTIPNAVDHDSLRAVNTVTRRQGANDPVCRPTADQQRRIDSMIARARSIRPPRRDSIMNGADDDGSGTVVMLEIAEQFVKEKPARSILFVSHQGEEAGLLGSRWFTDHPTVPLAAIVAAHNMDMEGKGRVEQVKFGGPASVQTLGARRLSREFGDIIDSVNAVRSEVMAIDKSWDVTANPMNRFCRSDQVNYVRHDVPVTYFSTGYAQDYHQPTDEPRYIDYEHSARIGRFIHDVMWAISERRTKPAIAGADPSYPSCGR